MWYSTELTRTSTVGSGSGMSGLGGILWTNLCPSGSWTSPRPLVWSTGPDAFDTPGLLELVCGKLCLTQEATYGAFEH